MSARNPNMDRFSEYRNTELDTPDYEREEEIAADRADHDRDMDIEREADERQRNEN